jgi:hypothetical protein
VVWCGVGLRSVLVARIRLLRYMQPEQRTEKTGSNIDCDVISMVAESMVRGEEDRF